jgi:hypothetical protein
MPAGLLRHLELRFSFSGHSPSFSGRPANIHVSKEPLRLSARTHPA